VVDVLVGTLPVVVVVARQLGPLPGVGQASQQLAQVPTVPLQCAASFLTLHLVPVAVVMQQVTAPAGFPQVECAAHFLTKPAQPLLTRTVFTCCTAQLT
jgi:hypothetical protein